jgi:hypothetical protein
VTLPRTVFEIRKSVCVGCQAEFREHLTKAGRPAVYCRRCRKDYKLYPGASRRQRQRVKLKGWEVRDAQLQAQREIRDRVLGKREED